MSEAVGLEYIEPLMAMSTTLEREVKLRFGSVEEARTAVTARSNSRRESPEVAGNSATA